MEISGGQQLSATQKDCCVYGLIGWFRDSRDG
jgi:hypothetical protein